MTKTRNGLSLMLVVALLGLSAMARGANQRQTYAYDRTVQQLIQRIETRANSFRTSLDRALDRSRFDATRREDNINQLVSDFEQATNQMRDRFNANLSTSSDIEMVLDRAARIDRFMRRHALATPAERQWNSLKSDLNALAGHYNIAWNWSDSRPDDFGVNDRWTGTFSLNVAQSDNPRSAVERAVSGLPYSQRQRAYNVLLARVSAPEIIALERQRRTITLASSRAERTTFEADGREHLELYPNSNRTSRVRATLTGGQFTISSTGDRATDFSVTFDPLNNGNRLRVTRRLYAERLAQPVVIQSVYDRISDVAQWNVYTGTPRYPGGVAGNYIVPDGTSLLTRLNTGLDTDYSRAGDRFTLTVLSPAQFEGATIDGVVGQIDRGGRITGRTEMSLNLYQIRLRNGVPYQFEGIIENVRAANGEDVNLDLEGVLREDDSQTERAIERGAIGAAIGAIIGAISEGGKGAAIGAVLGGGAGAGSVYVQGQNDLELMRGSEMRIRAIAPRSIR